MRNGTKRRRKRLYENLADFLEIPADQVAKIPVFTIRGKREIEIEGCTGILEYEPERIVLAVGRDRFTVEGSALILEDFAEKTLYIRGEIRSARFGREGTE